MKQTEEFTFERQYRQVLDRIYQDKGWEYRRVIGPDNRQGDVYIDGVLTEEKGLHKDGHLTYEIVQALELFRDVRFDNRFCYLPIKALGNQFITKATQQIWICYDEEFPASVYRVAKDPLDAFYLRPEHIKQFPPRLVLRGYGITLTSFIPWVLLLKYEVAERIWSIQPELFMQEQLL